MSKRTRILHPDCIVSKDGTKSDDKLYEDVMSGTSQGELGADRMAVNSALSRGMPLSTALELFGNPQLVEEFRAQGFPV